MDASAGHGLCAPESSRAATWSGVGMAVTPGPSMAKLATQFAHSAAIRGSQELQFVPAKTKGEPQPVMILFPVYFRFPGAPPLPGDTVLKKGQGPKR